MLKETSFQVSVSLLVFNYPPNFISDFECSGITGRIPQERNVQKVENLRWEKISSLFFKICYKIYQILCAGVGWVQRVIS